MSLGLNEKKLFHIVMDKKRKNVNIMGRNGNLTEFYRY